MKFNVTFSYKEEYLPTKRHRIPRIREAAGSAEFSIKDISKSELVLALTTVEIDSMCDYYFYNGKFYRTINKDTETFVKDFSYNAHSVTTFDDVCERIQVILNDYLNVDGKIYVETQEPLYEVLVFGIGNNHGSTALMLKTSYCDVNAYCFNALQKDNAITFAKHVAEMRGDTESIDRIGKGWNIIVHSPEVITSNPQRNAKNILKEMLKEEIKQMLGSIIAETYMSAFSDSDFEKMANRTLEIANFDVEKYYLSYHIKEAIGEFLTEKKFSKYKYD